MRGNGHSSHSCGGSCCTRFQKLLQRPPAEDPEGWDSLEPSPGWQGSTQELRSRPVGSSQPPGRQVIRTRCQVRCEPGPVPGTPGVVQAQPRPHSRPSAHLPLSSSVRAPGCCLAAAASRLTIRMRREKPLTSPCLPAPTPTVAMLPLGVLEQPSTPQPRGLCTCCPSTGTPCPALVRPLSLLLVPAHAAPPQGAPPWSEQRSLSRPFPRFAELQEFVVCLLTGRGPESSLVPALLAVRVPAAALHPPSAQLPQSRGLS